MKVEELFSGNEQSVFLKDFFIVSPLGKRTGIGTFETFWNPEKYTSVENAVKNKECVVVDFLTNRMIGRLKKLQMPF